MLSDRAQDLRAKLDKLREPARSTALEQLQRLLAEGRPEVEALEAALGAAEEWERTRAPNVAGRQNTAPR